MTALRKQGTKCPAASAATTLERAGSAHIPGGPTGETRVRAPESRAPGRPAPLVAGLQGDWEGGAQAKGGFLLREGCVFP